MTRPRTKAQREAEKIADAKRPPPVSMRLSPEQRAWIEEQRRPGESMAAAVKRMAGMPEDAT